MEPVSQLKLRCVFWALRQAAETTESGRRRYLANVPPAGRQLSVMPLRRYLNGAKRLSNTKNKSWESLIGINVKKSLGLKKEMYQ